MFLHYINRFRAIATLFVVINHSIHGLQWGIEYDNYETSRLLKIVFSNGAFFFVFISGFLFQHLLHKYRYRPFLVSRFQLVILPYLLISIPAVLAWTFVFQKSGMGIPADFYAQPWWQRVAWFYATGLHMAPVWFIPMIALYYLASPLFQLLDRYPLLYLGIPLLLWLSWEVPRHWAPWIASIHFLSVYVIGMAASRWKDIALAWSWRLRWLLVAGFLAAVSWELLMTPFVQSYFNYLNKLCLSFLVIAALWHWSARPMKALSWFAGLNFAVFFLHTYANVGMKTLFAGGPGTSIPIVGNVLYQAVYVAILVGLSILGTLLIRRLFGRYSKYVVGA